MKYALDVSTAKSYSNPQALADLAAEAKEAGWDGFFVWAPTLPSQWGYKTSQNGGMR